MKTAGPITHARIYGSTHCLGAYGLRGGTAEDFASSCRQGVLVIEAISFVLRDACRLTAEHDRTPKACLRRVIRREEACADLGHAGGGLNDFVRGLVGRDGLDMQHGATARRRRMVCLRNNLIGVADGSWPWRKGPVAAMSPAPPWSISCSSVLWWVQPCGPGSKHPIFAIGLGRSLLRRNLTVVSIDMGNEHHASNRLVAVENGRSRKCFPPVRVLRSGTTLNLIEACFWRQKRHVFGLAVAPFQRV